MSTDNTSAARVAVGASGVARVAVGASGVARVAVGASAVAPGDVDLSTLGCVLKVDGDIIGTATGAALLGDPARCVAMLADHLGRNLGVS